MTATAGEDPELLAGGRRGTSVGQRVFGVAMSAVFLVLGLGFDLWAVGESPAALVASALTAVFGYATLQGGFHTCVEWSPRGLVLRRVWMTRTLPWEAVTRIDASAAGAGVLASRPEPGSWPVCSPDLQIIRTNVLGGRPSHATRTAAVLGEYRRHMPPAVPGARITTTATRPGAVAAAWLVVQGLLLSGSALLIVLT